MADCIPEVKDNAENICKSASKSCRKKLVTKAKLSLQKKNRLREKSSLLKDVFDQFTNLNETCEFKDGVLPQFVPPKEMKNSKKTKNDTKGRVGKRTSKKERVTAKVDDPLVTEDVMKNDSSVSAKNITESDHGKNKKFVKLKEFSYGANKEKLVHKKHPDMCLQTGTYAEEESIQKSQAEFGGVDVFHCHICQKDLTHMNSACKTQHINKCMDKVEESETKTKKKTRKGQNKAVENGRGKRKNATSKLKDVDEDTQVAMAMSLSTEDERLKENNELIGQRNRNTKQESISKVPGKRTSKRKKESPIKTSLQTLSSEEKLEKISLRVAALLGFSDSCVNIEPPATPCFKRSSISETINTSNVTSSLWNMSAQIDDISTSSYYVTSLVPPICISKLKAGMNIKHMHEIPGRDITLISSPKQVGEDKDLDTKSSQVLFADVPFTQTAMVLAELVNDEDSVKSQKVVCNDDEVLISNSSTESESFSVKSSSKLEKDMDCHDISCVVGVQSKVETMDRLSQKIENKQASDKLLSSLQKDMLTLVNDSEFSDVKISTKDESYIAAHKSILVTRCKAFRDQLESDLTIINMKTYGHDAVIQFLNFLYAGHVELNIFNVQEIFTIGKIFEMQELESLCKSFIEREGLNETFLEPNNFELKGDNDVSADVACDLRDIWGDSDSESLVESPNEANPSPEGEIHSKLKLDDFVTDLLSQETELSFNNKKFTVNDGDYDKCSHNSADASPNEMLMPVKVISSITNTDEFPKKFLVTETKNSFPFNQGEAVVENSEVCAVDDNNHDTECENSEESEDLEISFIKMEKNEVLNQADSVNTLIDNPEFTEDCNKCDVTDTDEKFVCKEVTHICEEDAVNIADQSKSCSSFNDCSDNEKSNSISNLTTNISNASNQGIIVLSDDELFEENGKTVSESENASNLQDYRVFSGDCQRISVGSSQSKSDIQLQSDEELFSDTDNDLINSMIEESFVHNSDLSSLKDNESTLSFTEVKEYDDQKCNETSDKCLDTSHNASKVHNTSMDSLQVSREQDMPQDKPCILSSNCTDQNNLQSNISNRCAKRKLDCVTSFSDKFVTVCSSRSAGEASTKSGCHEEFKSPRLPVTKRIRVSSENDMDDIHPTTNDNKQETSTPLTSRSEVKSNFEFTLESPEIYEVSVHLVRLPNISFSPCHNSTKPSIDSDLTKTHCSDTQQIHGLTKSGSASELDIEMSDDEDEVELICTGDDVPVSPRFSASQKSSGTYASTKDYTNVQNIDKLDREVWKASSSLTSSMSNKSDDPKLNLCSPNIDEFEEDHQFCSDVLEVETCRSSNERCTSEGQNKHTTDVHSKGKSSVMSSPISCPSNGSKVNKYSPNIDEFKESHPLCTVVSSETQHSNNDEALQAHEESETKLEEKEESNLDLHVSISDGSNNVDVWDDFDDCGYSVEPDFVAHNYGSEEYSPTGCGGSQLASVDNDQNCSSNDEDQHYSGRPSQSSSTKKFVNSSNFSNKHNFEHMSSKYSDTVESHDVVVDRVASKAKSNKDDDICVIESDNYNWSDESMNEPVTSDIRTPTVNQNNCGNKIFSEPAENETPKNLIKERLKSRNPWVPPSPFTPMPEYDNMKTPHLKKEMQRYGLRPVGKNRMINALKNMFQQTHQYITDSEYEDEVVEIKKKQAAVLDNRCDEKEVVKSVADKQQKLKKERAKKTNAKKTKKTKSKEDQINDGRINKINTKSDQLSAFSKNIEQCDFLTSSSSRTQLDSELTASSSHFTDQRGSRRKSPASSLSSGDESDTPVVLEETMFISNDVEDDDITSSQLPTSDLGQRLKEFFMRDPDLHSKVLFYEPLPFDWLKSKVKEADIKCSVPRLMEYLDEKCITFTLKSERGKGRQRKKKSKKNVSD